MFARLLRGERGGSGGGSSSDAKPIPLMLPSCRLCRWCVRSVDDEECRPSDDKPAGSDEDSSASNALPLVRPPRPPLLLGKVDDADDDDEGVVADACGGMSPENEPDPWKNGLRKRSNAPRMTTLSNDGRSSPRSIFSPARVRQTCVLLSLQ